MKRDWNLIKELLLRIECLEFGHHFAPQALAEHDAHSVKYHLQLMHQAGLVECTLDQAWDGEPELIAHHLSLHGHDLLDAIRDSDARKYSMLGHSASLASREDLRQTA
ncbi:MAG TPA: DUF2513 domain-containing protein [Pseudomonas sp.]|nr:DUF2513 domain-containing protein [Pseudomonas sp.]